MVAGDPPPAGRASSWESGAWSTASSLAVIALGGLSLLQWQRQRTQWKLESEDAEDISFVYESLIWENGDGTATPTPPELPGIEVSTPGDAPRHHDVTKTPHHQQKTPSAASVVKVTDWGAVPDGKTELHGSDTSSPFSLPCCRCRVHH